MHDTPFTPTTSAPEPSRRVAEAETLCALMPVHAAVEATHLAAALDSIARQDRPADEIVIIEDGTLPNALSSILARFQQGHPECRRIQLRVSRGAGLARQRGLEAAESDWVALVDSDDICLPHRFRTQMSILAKSGAAMTGSSMIEFEGTPGNVVGLRAMPEEHSDIALYARLRIPVNNPTIVFKRETALAVGGYQDLRLVEDYDLVARFLASGAAVVNTAEPLVLFRTSGVVFRRRKQAAAHRSELRLQSNLYRYGLISRRRSVANLLIRTAYRLLPAGAARRVYRRSLLTPWPPHSDPASASPLS